MFSDISSLGVASEKIKTAEHSGLNVDQIKKVKKMRESLPHMKKIVNKDLMDLEHAVKKPTDHVKLFQRDLLSIQRPQRNDYLNESSCITVITEWKKVGPKASMGTKTPGTPAVVKTENSERIDWLLNTVPGTSIAQFEAIEKLPDKGAGQRIPFPLLNYQHYVGKTT